MESSYDEPDDILAIPDVASLLKVAEKTVYGPAQKGDLPAFKVGGQWRFRRTAIDSWIDVKTQAASGQLPNNGPKPSRSNLED